MCIYIYICFYLFIYMYIHIYTHRLERDFDANEQKKLQSCPMLRGVFVRAG